MDETIIYITKKRLVKAVGQTFSLVLKDLKDQGLLNSFEEAIEIRFDKNKAIHIQTVLEFYDTREVNDGPKHNKKEE